MKVSLNFFPLMIVLVMGEPPSDSYGPPRTGGGVGGGGGGYPRGGGGGAGVAPSPSYGPPRTGGGGGGGGGDDQSQPANYNFAYEVKDAKSGNDFGHMESRQGDSAKGSYHVLLPDGRTQKVDYTADQAGYMPKVIYEGEARPDSFGPAPAAPGTGVGVGGDIGGYRY